MTLQVEEVRITGDGIEAKINGEWLMIIAWEFGTEGVEGSLGPGPGPVGSIGPCGGDPNAHQGTDGR